MLPHCLPLQAWLWQCGSPGLGCRLGAAGQLPSSAPSSCPTSRMPYLEEGHVLAIVLLALLQVRAVNEGAALLGVAIACRDTTESLRQPRPARTCGASTPQGHCSEGSRLPGELPGLRAPCLHPVPAQGTAAPPPTAHTGRGCHRQEPHAVLAGCADTRSRQSASTQ